MGTFFISLAAVLFTIDLLLKQQIDEEFDGEEEKELIPERIVIRKVYNKGFLLHFMEKYPLVIKGVSAILGILTVLYDAVLFMKKGKWLRKFGMAVFTAGALSNLFDRLVRGKVIDYIGFRSKKRFLARLTVNLADIFIVFGTVLISLLDIFGRNKRKKKDVQ